MLHHYRTLIAMLTLFIAPTAIAHSQAATPVPCSTDEYRQLDFWVGEWNASWKNPDGSPGNGTNKITKDEYGSCVIFERFSMPGFKGMSVSTYHAALGKWRQTWVDDQGAYLALVGGPSDDEDIHFKLELSRQSDNAPYLRMIWQNVSEDAFVWRWQNKQGEDGEWQDAWVINYERTEKTKRPDSHESERSGIQNIQLDQGYHISKAP